MATSIGTSSQFQAPLSSSLPNSRALAESHTDSIPPSELGSIQGNSGRGGLHLQQQWNTYSEIKVKVFGLPKDITTLEVADIFSEEGSIYRIDLITNSEGSGRGIAFVVFSPPPRRDFWRRARYHAHVPNRNLDVELRIHLQDLAEPTFYKGLYSGTQYPETMTLSAESLDFGILYDEETMKLMYSTQATSGIPVTIRQSLRFRNIEVSFPVKFRGVQNTENPKGLKYEIQLSSDMPLILCANDE